eukprot:Rhum_TRINITY_DN4142_c0_g1::Rhum_TRINITY_DN4142_c0_g1_i1::g.13123::m.13123
MCSHPEKTELRGVPRSVARGSEGKAQSPPRVLRGDDTVVPQPGARVVARALVVVLVPDALHLVLVQVTDLAQHGRSLVAAHHANTRVGPHKHEARVERPATHAVVAGAVRSSDHEGDLRHVRGRHSGHHLGAVLRDTSVLVLLADHEAGDVLDEQKRNTALRAQLDEVRGLHRRLREEHAVVRDNADLATVQAAEAAHDRVAVQLLELIEARAVEDARNDLPDVEGRDHLGRHVRQEARHLGRRVQRLLVRVLHQGLDVLSLRPLARLDVQVLHAAPGQEERVLVGRRQVVDDTAVPRVHVAAAQLLLRHDLARGGLHQRRAAEEDGARLADDDRLVSHGRDVGATGRARAHHDGNLRNTLRRHVSLVVEDAAEVLLVREHVRLVLEHRTAGVHQVDAGKVVLLRDLLRPDMLLHRDRVVRASLHSGVVRHDHALHAVHHADAGDNAAGGRAVAVVHVESGELRQLEERGVGVDQALDTLARQKLATLLVLGDRLLAAALLNLGHGGPEVGHLLVHTLLVGDEGLVRGVIRELDLVRGTLLGHAGVEGAHGAAPAGRNKTLPHALHVAEISEAPNEVQIL